MTHVNNEVCLASEAANSQTGAAIKVRGRYQRNQEGMG